MRPTTILASLVAMFGALSIGCDTNDLENPEHVRTWATNGSALAVWSHVNEPFSYAFGAGSFGDPTCPARSDDGDTVTITGGCSTADGHRYAGSATITRGEGDVHTLTLDGYGSYDDPDFRTLTDGTATVTPRGDTSYDFEVDLKTDALTASHIVYSGTIEGDYSGPSTWNGSGSVTRDGFGEPTGTVTVSTVDEVRDTDVCGQPLSGYTTIESEGDTVVVTYDGATDCDEDKAATWTFNGRDRGRITGIDCDVGAAGAVPSVPATLAAFAVLVTFVIAMRIRRRNG